MGGLLLSGGGLLLSGGGIVKWGGLLLFSRGGGNGVVRLRVKSKDKG